MVIPVDKWLSYLPWIVLNTNLVGPRVVPRPWIVFNTNLLGPQVVEDLIAHEFLPLGTLVLE